MLPRATAILSFAASLAVSAGGANAQEFEESFRFDGRELLVGNVVGAVVIENHDGSGFEVVARVRGEDATRDAVAFDRDEGASSLVISFPGERKLSYPEMHRRSNVRFSFDPESDAKDSFLDGIFRRGRGQRVTVSGGRGFEAWVDLTIRIPAGGSLVLKNGVGTIEGEGLEAALDLSTRYGDVRVASAKGDVTIDTGNGDVNASSLEGRVDIDTGNGDVDLVGATGESVVIDSGNGHIVAESISCERLQIDTGNGRIEASGVTADSARLDTGNGSVDIDFDELGGGRYIVDTGNGSIDVRLPETASADVEADTGRGRVRLDVNDDVVEILRKRRDNVRFRMGDGVAQIRLDSGNGSIRIST